VELRLIPGIMHYTARHFGVNPLIKAIQGTEGQPVKKENRDAWRQLLGFPALP
jgi:hypothetical protein